MTAQSERLNVVASNLANADSSSGADGQAYHAKQVVFEPMPMGDPSSTGVRVSAVVNDPRPMKKVYDPSNPLADSNGYITQTNVNAVEEMVNMISASRSYQNDVAIAATTTNLLTKTLSI